MLHFFKEDRVMKYRKYCIRNQAKIWAMFTLALGLSSCAYTQPSGRQPDSVQTEDDGTWRDERGPASRFDGREPSSMRGDFTWLDQVEEDFGRIAAENSSRALASQNKREILVKHKDWSFSFLPRTNQFFMSLQGVQYQMVQTKIDDGEHFSFAALGQSENPLTFAVAKSGGEGRKVASSGGNCAAEISYWSKSARSYVTEHKTLQGKACSRVLTRLKEYVP